MATAYAQVLNNLFDPSHVPALDGNGVLFITLQLLQRYDSSDALVTTNPFADVIAKIEAAVTDSPLRREVLQLLESRSSRYAQGAR